MSTDSPLPHPRVIVLCFDGTSSQYASTNTNVVKFYALLDKCHPLEQIVYYQPGIGTFFNPGVVSPLLTWVAKTADVAIAWYLDQHVRAGYKFLMQNYRAGDKICLFGFSRGAYTARALAGLLHKIGLLPRDNEEQIPFAYTLYKRSDKTGLELAAGFKQTFCAPVHIDFLGVWDTVASVGLIYSRNLPFTSANSAVKMFRHALSLDERRARFQPNLFHHETPEDAAKRKNDPKIASVTNATTAPHSPVPTEPTKPRRRPGFGTRWGIAVQRHSSHGQHQIHGVGHTTPTGPKTLSPGREAPSTASSTLSRGPEHLPAVQEVWFAGCHSDVGGGAVKDAVRYSLGDISLRWMVKQVILSQCGIRFEVAALRRADIEVSTIVLAGPAQQTVDQLWRRKSEAEAVTISSGLLAPFGEDGGGEDMIRKGKGKDVEEQIWPQEEDVLTDTHDKLKSQPWWWFLELMPMKFTRQEVDGKWKSKWGTNFGRGRKIRSEQPNFHESVRQRMAVVDPKYGPNARWTPGTERYVD